MDLTVTFLLSIGMCLLEETRAQMEPLPRPTLWAVPGPVVPKGTDVTLMCQGQLRSDRFQLWKDGELREERNASRRLADFIFMNVDDERDARSYSCRSGHGPLWSEHSEPLALVVTGALPEPSIRVSSGSTISPGTTVSIWCQTSPQAPSQDYSFVLLEAKTLEPLQLQSPAGIRADFSLPSVRPKDTGNYSCIYYKKIAPHRGSHHSRTLMLTVLGQLPKPTLWAQPDLVMTPGTNITLWCSRPKLSSIEEVTFTLWKAGTQEPLQYQTSENLWTDFFLLSVRPKNTGSYSCTYRKRSDSAIASEHSDSLEVVITGSLPKPSLSALPDLVVKPGTHVTLQCQQPHQAFLAGVSFTLLKVGTPRPLQSQSPPGTVADFFLLSVRVQDAGNYSCVYYMRMAPYHVSEPSEVLEIWVTDALPKPSLSVWPGPDVASGADVTLLCWGPSWATRIVLYKDSIEKNLPSKGSTQNGGQYFLTHVTSKHSGNYSCSYQVSTNGSLWTQHSDPLELIVTEPNYRLIIILSCAAFLFLLLLCLFVVKFCHGSNTFGLLAGRQL